MKTLGLLTFALLAVFSVSVAIAKRAVAEASVTLSWPHVCGVVLTSQVVSAVRHWPKASYSYRVGDNTYTGTRIRLGDFSDIGTRKYEDARAEIDHFKVGAVTAVFYDPANPSSSVLEPHVLDMFGAYPTLGFIATFVMLVLVMRQVLVAAPGWVFFSTLAVLFVLWVQFLISSRTEGPNKAMQSTCEDARA